MLSDRNYRVRYIGVTLCGARYEAALLVAARSLSSVQEVLHLNAVSVRARVRSGRARRRTCGVAVDAAHTLLEPQVQACGPGWLSGGDTGKCICRGCIRSNVLTPSRPRPPWRKRAAHLRLPDPPMGAPATVFSITCKTGCCSTPAFKFVLHSICQGKRYGRQGVPPTMYSNAEIFY